MTSALTLVLHRHLDELSCVAVATGAAFLLDRAASPRGRRDHAALTILVPVVLLGFGIGLAAVGRPVLAAGLVIACALALVLGSNAKSRVLGEPFCFSDVAAIGPMIRHPRFYITAVSRPVRLLAVPMSLAIAATLIRGSNLRLEPRLEGSAFVLLAVLALRASVRGADACGWMATPDLTADVRRWGLIPTVVIYAWRWRHIPDPAPPAPLAADGDAPELIVVVQCESFADPEMMPHLARRDPGPPPHLARARRLASQHGALLVSGFGAYTMRTEYGVLFGRSEDELGFRRFDPYLTAHRERAHALPARLARLGFASTFVHPFPLAFYNRARLIPAIGFETVLGPDAFPPGARRVGPYIADDGVADRILEVVDARPGRQLIFAVTMENHGPHDADRLPGCGDAFAAWRTHLGNSDAMLGRLIDALAARTRPALLVFYGDHRPSIPGSIEPGDGRTTPYVVIRFDRHGTARPAGIARACTPSDLHHVILASGAGSPASPPADRRCDAAADLPDMSPA